MEQNDKNMLSNLEKIFSVNGEDSVSWSNFLCDIISGNSKIIQETISILKQNLLNKEKVDLTLDMIDFLINYGSSEIIEQIAQKDFLKSILFLLKNKSKASVDIQKKIIFLTQKWYQKFQNDQKENTKGFIDIYNSLKKGGIIFPPSSYQIQTYTKYITDDESQNSLMKAKVIKKSIMESEEYNNSLTFANPFSNFENSNNNNTPSDEKCGLSNDNTDENKNNNINNNIENNNQKNKNDDFDDENPYLQKDDNDNENEKKINPFYIKNENNEKNNNFVNSNINDNTDNNGNNYNNNHNNNENNNLLNMDQIQEQQSKYPTYPSQISNLTNINNLNNNIQMNNPYLTKNKTMDTPYNQYTNKNNNINNFQQINNNNNNNHFNNNNNLNKNTTYNNSNYNNFNHNYNNNNNNFSLQSDYSLEAKYYKRILGNKLLQLNKWINEGKYSFNSGKLKEGIQEILNEISHCNNMMREYQMKGDRKAFETIRNMKMDIEQTCARYEALMNDKKIDPFYSSFSGNTRQYYFDKNNMFGLKENNITGIGNFDNYYRSSGLVGPSDYGYQDYEKEKEKTFGDKLSDLGNDVKEGFVKFGTAVKNTAVSGYEFIKKKIDS